MPISDFQISILSRRSTLRQDDENMVYGESSAVSKSGQPQLRPLLHGCPGTDSGLQKKEQAAADSAAGGQKKKKVTAAQLRVQKGTRWTSQTRSLFLVKVINDYNRRTDLSELSLGSTMKTKFPNSDDILNFQLSIEPDEGMYKGGAFNFNFAINQNFPHDPPKVKCTQKIYHPNIDLDGNVCLNILREDWKPVLNLNAVIIGLQVSSWSKNRHKPSWIDDTGKCCRIPLSDIVRF